MRVLIVTDSSTTVPDEYLARLGIIEVPAIVNLGDRSFLNKVELSAGDFYAYLASSESLPTTSQPMPQHFAEGYERAVAAGAEEIIAVCVSAHLSGTLNSAIIAAEQAAVPVHLWDTHFASLASGWQAIAAAEMAAAGMDAQTILARLAPIRERTQMVFTPATLKYVTASGRVPRLRGTIGELLNVKPILAASGGRLEPIGQVRGRRKSLEAILDRAAEGWGKSPVRAGICHANVLEDAEAFMAEVRERFNVVEGIIADVGPALAALAGPGVLGLVGYSLEE